MRFLARLIFTLLAIIFVQSVFFAGKISAEGEFETDYDVVYSTDTSGKTTVSQNITLTNKTPNYYADTFELKIGSTKVEEVKAQDSTGPLEASAKFDNNVTTITVHFNQKVIGAGKNLLWQLTYTSQELAAKSGQIWEISIPKLAKATDIDKYTTTVKVPRTFGPVAFALPSPKLQSQTSGGQEFSFDKDQLLSSGIAMSFGEKQVFSFKLNYFLENSNVTSQIEQIALPPDNNYQQIVLEKLDPKPIDVTVDKDGNFLAKYKLPPKKQISVLAEGYVEVFSKSFRNTKRSMSENEKSQYLQPQRYWETDNASIKEKANELKTPSKIYDFVSNYLKYSDERLKQPKIERKGAASAYSSPNDSVCMEFTDLFIAIARAASIPAREVEGYAYTQNERLRPLSLTLNDGDVLHSWPEYWDDNLGWVQIDPTWGSTSGGLDYFDKLDFNHITFVQRGLSSTSPFPAGAYAKPYKQEGKTVLISFAGNLPTPTVNPELSLSSPNRIIAGIPAKIDVNVTNTGSSSIFDGKLSISTSKLKIISQNPYDIFILPPYANRSYRFNLQNNKLTENTEDNLIVSFAGVQISKPIQIEPFYKIAISPIFAVSIIGSMLIIATGLILHKKFVRKKKN